MFPYIGIMADEEPKDSISPSGLYNTSDLGSLTFSGGNLSSTILGGRSELTLMAWLNVDDFSSFTSTGVRPIVEFNPSSYPISFSSNNISSQIRNSNGGNTIVSAFDTFLEDTFYHVCITQSLLNNRIRVYVNGVLLNSGVMSYPNDDTANTFRIQKQDGVSLAQFNAYNRELSEAEVAEHYVYDDDLLFAGVLGYDAMIASQRDGLVYSSSYTNTISIAGNEFTDKSGNGVTLLTQPTLTGQQIYVYTDANDLPSDITIYPVNASSLNGVDQYFNAGNPVELQNGGEITIAFTAKMGSTQDSFVVSKHGSLPSQGGYFIVYNPPWSTANEFTFAPRLNGTQQLLVTTGGIDYVSTFNRFVFTYDGLTIKVYVNGVLNNSKEVAGSLTANTANDLNIGRSSHDGLGLMDGDIYDFILKNSVWDSTEVAEDYNLGVYKCYDDKSTSLKIGDIYAPRLGNFNNNTGQELTDRSSSGITTTNVNNVPFTGTGLSVECGGTPTAPSNALPSNLPTIL